MPRLVRIAALLLAVAGSARAQVPVADGEVYDAEEAGYVMEDGSLFAECSLACAYGWTTTVSSVLAPQGSRRYDADALGDNRPSTAWVEGVEGDGIGERIRFTLLANGTDGEEAAGGQRVSFHGIELLNGYARDEATWSANGRIREAVVRVNGAPVQRLRFADSRRPQRFGLAPSVPNVGPGDVIELEITAVYPGERFHDTALSEIVLQGAH